MILIFFARFSVFFSARNSTVVLVLKLIPIIMNKVQKFSLLRNGKKKNTNF